MRTRSSPLIAVIGELVDTVASGERHPCDVAFGREVGAVLAAVERSTTMDGAVVL